MLQASFEDIQHIHTHVHMTSGHSISTKATFSVYHPTICSHSKASEKKSKLWQSFTW